MEWADNSGRARRGEEAARTEKDQLSDRSPPRRRVSEFLKLVADVCDHHPPPEWLRPGTPLVLLLFAGWLLPFMGAGIVRTLTGVSTEVGLIIATPIELLVAATFLARRRRPHRPDGAARALQAAGVLVGVLLVGWAWRLLYSRDMGALVAYYGLDGGSHVGFRRLFVERDPHTYFGFVTLYAATHLLDRFLPLIPGTSLALAFYSTLAIVVVAPLIATVAVLQETRAARGARLAGLTAFSLTWLFALRGFVIPILGNMQADGAYAHLFGFLPVALVWLADVLLEPRLLRLLWVGLALVLYRFTYGLNLPDLVLTCGALWLFDALRARRRVIPLFAGAGAITAAGIGYRALAPSFRAGGYTEVYPLEALVPLMSTAVLVLGVYGVVSAFATDPGQGGASAQAPMGPSRAIRLPVLFAFVALVAFDLFKTIPRVESYYLLKHPLMPLVWLSAAACVSVGHVMTLAWTGRRRTVVLVTGLALILLVGRLSDATDQVFAVMRAELEERNAPPPHPKLRPLVDEETWRFIDATLRNQHKTFGGLMSRDFPVAHFLNAWLGFHTQDQLFVAPKPTPGTCVFWTQLADDPTFTFHPAPFPLEVTRNALNADALKQCETYKAAWSVNKRTLCSRCY